MFKIQLGGGGGGGVHPNPLFVQGGLTSVVSIENFH